MVSAFHHGHALLCASRDTAGDDGRPPAGGQMVARHGDVVLESISTSKCRGRKGTALLGWHALTAQRVRLRA
jgi:hypothetical protein